MYFLLLFKRNMNRNILEKRKTLKIFYLKILEKLFLKKRMNYSLYIIYESFITINF